MHSDCFPAGNNAGRAVDGSLHDNDDNSNGEGDSRTAARHVTPEEIRRRFLDFTEKYTTVSPRIAELAAIHTKGSEVARDGEREQLARAHASTTEWTNVRQEEKPLGASTRQ